MTSSLQFNTLRRMLRELYRKGSKHTTRRGILNLLKLQGPADSRGLAEGLGISAMAVRQHLYALRRQKLVAFTSEPRRLGRPAKIWRLSQAAYALFPDRHAEFSVSMLDALGAAFGRKGLVRTLGVLTELQTGKLVSRISPNAPMSDRLQSLVSARNEQGYLAVLQPADNERFLVVQNHCPIRAAAEACPSLCEVELDSFRAVLGGDSTFERQEHILAGDRRCTYLVLPKKQE